MMLNGIDPIIIFNFKKLPPGVSASGSIPVLSSIADALPLPAIPIYLSERITGMYIDSEDKNIDVDTTIDSVADGLSSKIWQRPIGSTVKINMKASRDSLGISLISAMADLILPKLTSKEYSITYLHGAVTVFNGLLHSFSITQNANDTLYNIALELVNPPPEAKAKLPTVDKGAPAITLDQPVLGFGAKP